jgi:acetolactate synthase-1/2/3 large subunit
MGTSGADILCEGLVREGVEVIFGFPGGAVLPLYDALPNYPQLRHVLVRHEQGAAHAADGYARATGKVGVCFATSGPGATNLVTGIANAHLDSSPVVAVTGQVPRAMIGKDAFQEADITGITLPITKHNYMVTSAESLASIVKEAFYLARTGRPGPVLIDIPKDVFMEETEAHPPKKVTLRGFKPTVRGHAAQIGRAARLINEAQRPVIIAGRGVIISGAYDELKELAETAQIPVVTTLLGIGCFPQSHVLSVGMLGMHGIACANMAVCNADLVIAVGMRFDDRATGRVDDFAPNARIVHIDIDPAEIGKNVRVDVPIVGDVRNVLQSLNRHLTTQTHVDWIEELEEWRRKYPCAPAGDSGSLLAENVVIKICEVTGGDSFVVSDVGQNQMWVAQHFHHRKPNGLISSGGLGTMGFALPAAIGAKIGCPGDTVWAICGDGGFQMTIQELGTAVQERAAVKIAILNNGYLGMVRQWQEMFYERRYIATPIAGPDFVKIGEAYGIPGLRVTAPAEVGPAVEQAMSHDGPFLIEFVIEPEENVFPMVPPGAALAEFIDAPKGVSVGKT